MQASYQYPPEMFAEETAILSYEQTAKHNKHLVQLHEHCEQQHLTGTHEINFFYVVKFLVNFNVAN